jgi:hypothetical protein
VIKYIKLEHKTTEQEWTIKEQYAEINAMYNKMSGLEIRIESQELNYRGDSFSDFISKDRYYFI